MEQLKLHNWDNYDEWFKFYYQSLVNCHKMKNIKKPLNTWTLGYFYDLFGIKENQQMSLFEDKEISREKNR